MGWEEHTLPKDGTGATSKCRHRKGARFPLFAGIASVRKKKKKKNARVKLTEGSVAWRGGFGWVV